MASLGFFFSPKDQTFSKVRVKKKRRREEEGTPARESLFPMLFIIFSRRGHVPFERGYCTFNLESECVLNLRCKLRR